MLGFGDHDADAGIQRNFFRCVTWVILRLLPTTQELVGEFFLKSSEAWDVSPAIHRSIPVVGDPRCESKNVLTELLPL